ncbi:hypothetical protein [Sporosarcina ureae]|uniref:hypothetical protein n=1 Tax=Sporosarcina ureae TaxID=1571 RepID=UPI000A17B7FE|nr:hypothetical protein [Sporosarcina ureae]ARK20096.1 hypothetical protein SporoP32a_00145 [Sporosarcina ureae]
MAVQKSKKVNKLGDDLHGCPSRADFFMDEINYLEGTNRNSMVDTSKRLANKVRSNRRNLNSYVAENCTTAVELVNGD